MSDEQLRKAYEQRLPSGTDRPPLDDVSAERLRRLVDREGSDEERLHTIDAMLSTAAGRRELEIVWAAARAATPRRRPRTGWMAVASLLLVAGVTGTWWVGRPTGDVLRSETSPIALVSPIGDGGGAEVSRFVWRALRDASRYTLVVVDTAGNEVFAAETRDTSVTMPDTVKLERGREYLWWVQATTNTGSVVTAVTQRVVITAR